MSTATPPNGRIRLRCPEKHLLAAPRKLAGQAITCPKCGANVRVPETTNVKAASVSEIKPKKSGRNNGESDSKAALSNGTPPESRQCDDAQSAAAKKAAATNGSHEFTARLREEIRQRREDAQHSTVPGAIPDKHRHAFDLDRVIGYLGEDPICTRDLVQGGIFTVGATGTGKTSGVFPWCVKTLLSIEGPDGTAGPGLFALTTKSDDADNLEKLIASCGRAVNRFSPTSDHYLDFMETAQQVGDGRINFTQNTVELLMSMARANPRRQEYQAGDVHWEDATSGFLTLSIDLVRDAKGVCRLEDIEAVLRTLAQSPDDLESQQYSRGFANQMLETVFGQPKDEIAQKDFDQLAQQFIVHWPRLNSRTRTSIENSLSPIFMAFRGEIRRRFCSGRSNLRLEDCWEKGDCVIVDFPIDRDHETGRIVNRLMKRLFIRALSERRPEPFMRPVIALFDEYAWHIDVHGDHDNLHFSGSRSKACVNVVAVQSADQLHAQVGGGPKAQQIINSIANNLVWKVFLQASGPQAEWNSKQIGDEYVFLPYAGGSANAVGGTGYGGASMALQPIVPPSKFHDLKTGGPRNDGQVEAIVFANGRRFSNGKVFKKVVFQQDLTEGN